jgi:hypothetical protein
MRRDCHFSQSLCTPRLLAASAVSAETHTDTDDVAPVLLPLRSLLAVAATQIDGPPRTTPHPVGRLEAGRSACPPAPQTRVSLRGLHSPGRRYLIIFSLVQLWV